MKILYVAYSCSPTYGSEDAIGWNTAIEMSKENEVIVITKKEHEFVINDYLKRNQHKNLKFIFTVTGSGAL